MSPSLGAQPETVWKLQEADETAAQELQRLLGLSPVIARVLASRGLTEADAVDRFLRAPLSALRPPMEMKGMAAAADRIVAALDSGERVRVFGDYDVDGQTSASVMVLFLRAVGGNVDYVIADRHRDGYGLSERVVQEAADQGVRLLLTCDSGITAVTPISLARDLGVDTIIIDHHKAPPELPPATAVLNPHQPGCPFPFKGLCAAGVAFYLAAGVRQRLRELGREGLPDIRELLDVVAIGTIGDVVPLEHENRAIVRYGLRLIAEKRRPGIRALLKVSGVRGSGPGDVNASTVGYRLAPRLNAAGRMGDATRGVRLLTTSDDAEAEELAAELDGENERRREVERQNLEEAMEQSVAMVDAGGELPAALVVASEGWHQGVVGIVAARLVDRYARPAAVIALTEKGGRASVRAPAGFHAYDALKASAEHLTKWGGHAAAAGFSVEAASVDAFRRAFIAAARDQLGRGPAVREIPFDAEVSLSDVDFRLAEQLRWLAPFGEGNPEPLLVVRGARAVAERVVKERHLRLRVDDGSGRHGAIAFGMGDRHPLGDVALDVAFHVEESTWQGRAELSLRVRDLKVIAAVGRTARDAEATG